MTVPVGFEPLESNIPAGFEPLTEDEIAGPSGFDTVTDDERNFIEELGSSLGAGAVSTASSIAGTGELIGIPGSEDLRKKIEAVGEHESLQRPEHLRHGTILENPERGLDWRWWVRSFGENIPNLAATFVPGGAVLKGAQALRLGVGATKAAGLAGAALGSFSVEAGSAYTGAKNEMEQTGEFTPDEIEKIATNEAMAVGFINPLLDIMPFGNLIKKSPVDTGLVKKAITQAFLEGSTESVQEVVNILAEKYGGHKPDQTILDNAGRIIEAGIVGFGLGGGVGTVAEIAGGKAKKKRDVQNDIAADMSDEEIMAFTKEAEAAGLDVSEIFEAKTNIEVNSPEAILEEEAASVFGPSKSAEESAGVFVEEDRVRQSPSGREGLARQLAISEREAVPSPAEQSAEVFDGELSEAETIRQSPAGKQGLNEQLAAQEEEINIDDIPDTKINVPLFQENGDRAFLNGEPAFDTQDAKTAYTEFKTKRDALSDLAKCLGAI